MDRQESRALLKRMEYEAAEILRHTPDSAEYVTNADNLALDVQRLADYLNALDAKPVGKRTDKRATPSWYAPDR
jgi:hypothetical protein